MLEAGVRDLDGGPILARSLPGRITSWTPPLEHCLEHGRRYGWTVRGILGDGDMTSWSEPALFSIDPMPSPEDLDWALEVLRRYRESMAAPEPATAAFQSETSDAGRGAWHARLVVSGAAAPVSTLREIPPAAVLPDGYVGFSVVNDFPMRDEKRTGIYSHIESAKGGAAIVGSGRIYTSATTPEPVDGVQGFSDESNGVYGRGSPGVRGVGDSFLGGLGGSFWGYRGLEVEGTVCCDGASYDEYAVGMISRSTGANPDLLALWIDKANVTAGMNFIGLFDGGGVEPHPENLIGEIEGDGLGGVRYKGGSVILYPTDSPATCDSSTAGGLYFDLSESKLCQCSGSGGWQPVDGAGSC